jgi:hypothetical protein
VRLKLELMTTTPQGLVMGVQIHGPKDSWLRFGVLEVPWESVPRYVVDDYYKWYDRDSRFEESDVPLPLDFA